MESYSYYNRNYIGDSVLTKNLFDKVFCVVKEKGDTMTVKEWEELYRTVDATYRGPSKLLACSIMAKHEKCPASIIDSMAFAVQKPDVLNAIYCRENVSQWLADCVGTGALPIAEFINIGRDMIERETTKKLNPKIMEAVLKLNDDKRGLKIACTLHKKPDDIVEALKDKNDNRLFEAAIANPYVPAEIKDRLFDEGVEFEAIIPDATPYMAEQIWQSATEILFEQSNMPENKKGYTSLINRAQALLSSLIECGHITQSKELELYHLCANNVYNKTKKQTNMLLNQIAQTTDNLDIIIPLLMPMVWGRPNPVWGNPNIDVHKIDEEICRVCQNQDTYNVVQTSLSLLLDLYQYKQTVPQSQEGDEEKEKVPAEEQTRKLLNRCAWKNGHTEQVGGVLCVMAKNPHSSDDFRRELIEHGKTVKVPLSHGHGEAVMMAVFVQALKDSGLPCHNIDYLCKCVKDIGMKLPYYSTDVYEQIANAAHKARTTAHPRHYNTRIDLERFENRILAYSNKMEIDLALINLGCWIHSDRNATTGEYHPIIDFNTFLKQPYDERQKIIKELPTPTIRKIREAITHQVRGYKNLSDKMWDMVEADKMYKELYAEIKSRKGQEKEQTKEQEKEADEGEKQNKNTADEVIADER